LPDWSSGAKPVVDLSFSFIAGDAVALLQPSCQLLPLAFDDVEIVVRKLAPLLLRLALELFPIAFNGILIHGRHLSHLELPGPGTLRPIERSSTCLNVACWRCAGAARRNRGPASVSRGERRAFCRTPFSPQRLQGGRRREPCRTIRRCALHQTFESRLV
jgi:hypothetical protein